MNFRTLSSIGRASFRRERVSVVVHNRHRPQPFAKIKLVPSFVTASALFNLSSFCQVAAMSTSAILPKPPIRYESTHSVANLDLSELGQKIAKSEESRNDAFQTGREMKTAILEARYALEKDASGTSESSDKLEKLFSSVVGSISADADRTPREANLSYSIEDYVRLEAFKHFLSTAKLISPSQCKYATDEEYLAGACMGMAQDLARYGLGRATERDVHSVALARNLVDEILDELLQFDFRNGPLRRKYDGTKYALKSLETLLYELSVTGSLADGEPAKKKARVEDDGDKENTSLLPKAELQALRLRMEHRDELREKLIKKCRDGQKAAKQSIFALHRNDRKRADLLLGQCETCIAEELLPIVNEEPRLRYGSFANVLEEYAEAKLFYVWLFGKNGDEEVDAPSGELLGPQEFTVQLEPEEYLGGLCDLTGEVGRYAVQRGTARDSDAVTLSLHSNRQILVALQVMQRVPGGINKKMDQLRRSVEKLERMLYEMSLSEATGGRNVNAASDDGAKQEEG